MGGEAQAERLVFRAQFGLGENVDGVFHGVGGHDEAVVRLRKGSVKVALQFHRDFDFFDGVLRTGTGDFHDPHPGFAVIMMYQFHIAFRS
jgi:hypothetical protein